MINNLLKSTTFRLIILVCTVLATLIFSTLLFNSQIDNLKKQVDNIYFGNLLPIIKLQNISNNYKEIITCRSAKYSCDIKKEEYAILEEWKYYNEAYKNNEERAVCDSVNTDLLNSFKENKLHLFKGMLEKINSLIQYETQVVFKGRKDFLEEYQNMKNYLFYSIFGILLLSFIVITYIILQVIKKDKQLHLLNEKYKIESITDAMTTLYNRKYFDTIFDNMPFIANENNWKCAFIMIDIDYFKQYNDTYGHDMGDITLKKVASMLKEYFNKKYEFVFRLGGEEFGVVLFDTDYNSLEHCLKDLNYRVLELGIEHRNSKILDVVSISIGSVVYEPNSYISANKLYKLADECLYKSKENGRNQYHIYNKGTE
jgi:diguanylate cyclase (GGDEF)-like protein